jgi:hypothetical protein
VLELAGTPDAVAAGLALARTGGAVVPAGTVAPVGPVGLGPEAVLKGAG